MAGVPSRSFPWYSHLSEEVPKQLLAIFWDLFIHNALHGDTPTLLQAATLSWLPVAALVVPVCGTKAHDIINDIIKSVKRPSVPEFLKLIIKWVKSRPAPDFLKLSNEMVNSIHSLVNESYMCVNKRQCLDLSSKLSQTIQNIQNIQKLLFQCGFSDSVFRPALEHLYQVLLKAKVLVNDCSDGNWIGASVFQMQNESAFQVILMDVGFCYHAIYEQAKLSMNGEWKNVELEDLRESSTFKPAPTKDVDEDREELRERLENLFDTRKAGWLYQVYYFLLLRLSKRLRLAEYMLVKLQCIAHQPLSDGLQLSKRLLWEEESWPSITWGCEVLLGVGAGASGVCKTKWLNIPCAKKCNIPKPYFLKEAGILSHVNYPNIIKFICCGEKLKSGGDFIALELMEMSLSDLIKKKGKEGIPFSYAVDILAQIGRGVCYLHGLRVAHRDLKPANVVLNVLTSPHLKATYHVKLVDFGTSKTQVDPSQTTSTENGFGTLTHKAPEVRYIAPAKSEGDRKWRAVWFKADVWSFAVICLEVLSLKLRKSRDKEDEDLKSMFPADCPPALVALLEDCLQADPRARPDFFEICSRLEALRHGLLRRLPTLDQDSLSEMSVDCSHIQFIETRLKEHFQRQNDGVVADDEELEVLRPYASHVEERVNQDTFRMDQAPFLTAGEIRDLEIWTKQPGNEVFRKVLEEWREERDLIAERLHMTKDQEMVLNQQRYSMVTRQWTLILSFFLPVSVIWYRNMHYWWVADCSLLLLGPLLKLWLVFYHQRCFWLKFKAVYIEINKIKVLSNRIVILYQKREFFSFKDIAKEIDPSSKSPPKLTWFLLDFVIDACWVLLLGTILKVNLLP